MRVTKREKYKKGECNMLKCNSAPNKGMIICIVLCIILSTTPVTASVQDNLNLAISKLIGQKNETTTQAAYGNASTNAKLNYLESRVRNIESTLSSISTSSGSAPQCVESGGLTDGYAGEKIFTGSGILYVYSQGSLIAEVDGISCNVVNFLTLQPYSNVVNGFFSYTIPFKNSVRIRISSDSAYGYYTLYKY